VYIRLKIQPYPTGFGPANESYYDIYLACYRIYVENCVLPQCSLTHKTDVTFFIPHKIRAIIYLAHQARIVHTFLENIFLSPSRFSGHLTKKDAFDERLNRLFFYN
jgi:hypothetical protein